jgi:hypothetical protein
MLKISKKADYALMALQHIAAVQFGDVTPWARGEYEGDRRGI